MKLSVVIPAYNESRNVGRGVLQKVYKYLSTQDYQYEVVIVDDGSLDDTVQLIKAEIVGKKNFRLIENPHAGKAITVMTGLLQTVGEIAIFTDMDQATPINQLEKILPKFNEKFDIVIGKRHGRKGYPLIRKVYAYGFVVLRNILLGLPFSDTQCGFKAFSKLAIKEIFPDLLNSWQTMKTQGAAVNAGFDIEMLFVAKQKGLRIAEVPVEWHHVGSERVGVRAGIETIRDMFRIRINGLLGKYR